MTVLYIKNNDGFSVIDVEKAAESDLQKGIIVYDPSTETMAPQYLIQVNDEIRLYRSRRIEDQDVMRDSCKKYNSEKKEWEESNKPLPQQSHPQSLSPLSDAEKITLTRYHKTLLTQEPKKQYDEAIKNSDDFAKMLSNLSDKQCMAVCEDWKDQLLTIIQRSCLGYALRTLSVEQCTAVCSAVKDQLPNIIKSNEDFKKAALSNLSVRQCTAVFEAWKDQLPSIIKSGEDFSKALDSLSVMQRVPLFEACKDELSKIIKSGEDFSKALDSLSVMQRVPLFEACKDELSKIIKSGKDFRYALKYLSEEQRTAAYEVCKEQLPKIIKSGEDFSVALSNLSVGQRTAVFEACKDQLPSIIKGSEDFGYALEYLSVEQRVAVCSVVKDKFHDIIKDTQNRKILIDKLFHKINSNQKIDLLYALFDNVSSNAEYQKNALDDFTQKIVAILGYTQPGEIQQQQFQKAEQIILRQKNAPDVQFFGSPNALASYLKHKNYWDAQEQQLAFPR